MLVVASQEQLPLAEARAGDAQAWEILFKRYQLPLYVYVYELLQSEQRSFDVVQETFMNAVRYIGSLHDEDKFGAWLFSIAHQKCIQHWRKKELPFQDLAADEVSEVPADLPGPQLLLIRREQEETLMHGVDQLDLVHRSVILLYFFEEFSLEEIGAITGVPVGTVKSRLYYAKKTLRKILDLEPL